MSSISTLSSRELVVEFFLCVLHRDSNLTHASRNGILIHWALALPLELIHTLGFQLQAPRTLADFTLCNLSALEDCRQIFTSATFAGSLSFDVSSSDSQLGFGRRIC